MLSFHKRCVPDVRKEERIRIGQHGRPDAQWTTRPREIRYQQQEGRSAKVRVHEADGLSHREGAAGLVQGASPLEGVPPIVQ